MTSTDTLAALADRPAASLTQSERNEWTKTALTVLFTASAILFVSFLAVVTGLV